MKNNKKLKWGIIVIIFLVISYFIYKGINLYMYNTNNLEIGNCLFDLSLENATEIKKSQPLSEDDYLVFNNLKIKNYFKDFEKYEKFSTNDSIKYFLPGDEVEDVTMFWMGHTKPYIDAFKESIDMDISNQDIHTNITGESIIKKYNIKNDIELFRFFENKKNIENNIFTSVEKMKENYVLKMSLSSFYTDIISLNLIKGEYDGYVSYRKAYDSKEFSISHNGEMYYFTFFNTKYFTDDYISEILSTLVIE